MSGNGVNSPAGFTRTLQIIVAAMVAGCSLFLTIVLVIVFSGPSKSPDVPIITYIAVAFAAGAVAMHLIIPGIVVAQGRRKILAETSSTTPATQDDTSKFSQLLITKTIIAAAILEGAALFSLIAHIVERSPLSLGAAIVLIVMLAAHFPTQSRVGRWIDDQTRLISEERQLAG